VTFLGAIAVLTISVQTMAAPIIDGRLDDTEGYSMGGSVGFTVENTRLIPDDGQFWIYQDPITGELSVYFMPPPTLVDNTYGDNDIGWGKGIASSGEVYDDAGAIGEKEGGVFAGSAEDMLKWSSTLGYSFDVLNCELAEGPPEIGSPAPEPATMLLLAASAPILVRRRGRLAAK